MQHRGLVGRRRSVWGVALAGGVVTAVALSATWPALAQNFSFGTIQVEGNALVDDATVAGFARIPRGQAIGTGELNEAYQRVVNSGLFEEVSFEPRGNTLVITVTEFPIVSVLNIEGNRRLDDDALREVVQSRPNRVFSPAQAERDAIAIAELYRQRGRVAAEVTPRIIDRGAGRVDLVFEVREGAVVEIERISFVGNRAFSDNRLRRVLGTKQAGLLRTFIQSDTFIEERIEFDRAVLRDFYLARGFIDFQVLSVTPEISREGDAFFITFNLREGQQYRVGNVTVSSEIAGVTAADYEGEVRVRAGQVFTPTTVEATIARMERQASQTGLRFARVDPRLTRNERTGTVDIDFALVTGERIFVERIDIQGNVTTLDRVIRRQFRMSEGDPLNPREIREAAERIRALGYFSDVQVEGRPGSTPEQVVVDVNVEETTTGSLGFGISYSRAEDFGGSITFSETNFLGRGQILNFGFSTTSGSREFLLDFTEPAVRDSQISFGLRGLYRETDVRDWSAFATRELEFTPSLGFQLSEFGRLNLRYSLRSEEIRDVQPGISRIIAADEGRENTSSVGLRYTYDTGRTDLDPGRRLFLRLDQEFAGLGGDRTYMRTTALASYEQQVLNEEVLLRAELEGGAIYALDGNSRFTERFDVSSRMRGFEPSGAGPRDLATGDALRGNYYAVARFEAEFPLGLPNEYGLTGGLFVDIGSAWKLNDTNGGVAGGVPVDDSLRWRAIAGFSLFWTTPIGPLRFNFSTPLQSEDYDQTQNFDFTVSSRF